MGASGAASSVEPSFPASLRNLVARHPNVRRVVVWASGQSLLTRPDTAWEMPDGASVEVVRAPTGAGEEEIRELLRKAIDP